MNISVHITPKILKWDTEFFGFRSASFATDRHDEKQLSELINAAREQDVVFLTYHAPFGTVLSCPEINALADTRHISTFDFQTQKFDHLVRGSANIEEYSGTKSSEIFDELAVLSGQQSRFFTDPNFPDIAAKAMYKQWIRRSLSKELADVVWVTRDKTGDIAGFGTCRIDADGIGVPVLMAAKKSMAGSGAGRNFVLKSMQWLQERGVKTGRITTQGRNQLAANIYKKMGWQVIKKHDIFHIWLGRPIVKSNYF